MSFKLSMPVVPNQEVWVEEWSELENLEILEVVGVFLNHRDREWLIPVHS